jgi:hypothetical protein
MWRDGLARFREYAFMRKSVFVLAVIGAACSSAAFAGDAKKDKAHAPAIKATTMSDADMDKVTAGFNVGQLLSPPPGLVDNIHANNQGNGAFVGFNHGQCKGGLC